MTKCKIVLFLFFIPDFLFFIFFSCFLSCFLIMLSFSNNATHFLQAPSAPFFSSGAAASIVAAKANEYCFYPLSELLSS